MVEEIAHTESPDAGKQAFETPPVDALADANLEVNCCSDETVTIELGDNDIADATEVIVSPAEEPANIPVVAEKQPVAVAKASLPRPSAAAAETAVSSRPQEKIGKVEVPQAVLPKPEKGKTAVAQVVEVSPIVEKKSEDPVPASKKEIPPEKEAPPPAKKAPEETPEDSPKPKAASDGDDGNDNERPALAAEGPEPEKPPSPPLLVKEDFVFRGKELPQYPQFSDMVISALNNHCQEVHGNEVVEPPELQALRESVNEGICWLGEDIGIDLSEKAPTAAHMRYYENLKEHDAALEAAGAIEAGKKVGAVQRINSVYMTIYDDPLVNRVVLSHESIHQIAAQILELQHMEVYEDGRLQPHATLYNGYAFPGNALKELVADLAGVDTLVRSGTLDYIYSYFPLDVFGAALIRRVAEAQGASMKEVYHGLLRDMIKGSEEEGVAMLRASLSPEEFEAVMHMKADGNVVSMAHRLGLSGVEEEIRQNRPNRWYFEGYRD
jgi:hypothetical protein